MVQKLQLELPVLLPDIPDERDQCVQQLMDRLRTRRGIEHVHVDRRDDEPVLCLDYDTNLVSLAQVRRLAEDAAATITERFRHETLPITGMDCAGSIEHILGRLPGIILVSVSYVAERMRVEYDTTAVTHEEIVRRVEWMGYEVPEEKPAGWLAEHLAKGANPRFVVTSLPAERADAQTLYEQRYCARGEVENRIKEQQLGLFADRTSTYGMRSNQLRLLFSTMAYLLHHVLREFGLKGTEMETAQAATVRTKLLKIGGRIRISVRRVWISLSETYPYQELFERVLLNLRRQCPYPIQV